MHFIVLWRIYSVQTTREVDYPQAIGPVFIYHGYFPGA